jgi:antirestriction protein ArdC
MPWHYTDEPVRIPTNAFTGKLYRGINNLVLWSRSIECSYSSGIWATQKQWTLLGATLRLNEQPTTIIFWGGATNTSKNTTEADEVDERAGQTSFILMENDENSESINDTSTSSDSTKAKNNKFLARAFSVYNADQVDGYTLPKAKLLTDSERIEQVEDYFKKLNSSIINEGNQAYYSPSDDCIKMPLFESFFDPISYYSTLGHEHIHWTGHSERLKRDFSGRFGDEAYAFEELVAELGSAFLCGQMQLTNKPRQDHAAYIDSWLKVLNRNKRAIVEAASKAQKGLEWMNERAGWNSEEHLNNKYLSERLITIERQYEKLEKDLARLDISIGIALNSLQRIELSFQESDRSVSPFDQVIKPLIDELNKLKIKTSNQELAIEQLNSINQLPLAAYKFPASEGRIVKMIQKAIEEEEKNTRLLLKTQEKILLQMQRPWWKKLLGLP